MNWTLLIASINCSANSENGLKLGLNLDGHMDYAYDKNILCDSNSLYE